MDDHSRMALHVSAHRRVTGAIVLATFRAAVAEHGCPASTLTDNGMVYTVRHSSHRVRGGRNAFETELATLGVTQKNGRGNHPQTQGKVERFQQTLKTWLTRQPDPPATIEDLHARLEDFRHAYNHDRPHRALDRRTPAAAYTARPKAAPPAGEPADRTHTRVRHDKVNNGKITLRHGGTLYSIGLGRAFTGTAPSPSSSTACTSPSSTPPPAKSSTSSPSTPPAGTNPRTAKSPNPEGSGLADVLRHHSVGLTGFEPATP
nr:integrase core domain-containing protein [Phycicoccus avicenniae]